MSPAKRVGVKPLGKGVPHPVLHPLAQMLAEGRAREVTHLERRGLMDAAALVQNPARVLVVLIAEQARIEEAHAIEERAAPAAERHGVDPPARAIAERGAGGEAARDRVTNRERAQAVVGGHRLHSGADQVGAALLERARKDRDVLGRIGGVRVGAHHDLAARGANAEVEPGGVVRGDCRAGAPGGSRADSSATSRRVQSTDPPSTTTISRSATEPPRSELQRGLDVARLVAAGHHHRDSRTRRRLRRLRVHEGRHERLLTRR